MMITGNIVEAEVRSLAVTKILLVEDDKDLSKVICEYLDALQIKVDVVHDGADGYEFLRSGNYDAAVLDWDLPSLSGLDILKKHRHNKGITPILMLTGKGQVTDKETGLDSGADDYVTKPFNMREFAARVRALARRQGVLVSETLKVGDVELDPQKHLLFKAGKPAHLLPKDFELLEFLMRHPGEVFSGDTILMRVWSMNSEATSEAVRTSIKRIRQVIDDGADEKDSMIETLRRVGYRLKMPVEKDK